MALQFARPLLSKPVQEMAYTELLIRSDQLSEVREVCRDPFDRELIDAALMRLEIEIGNHEAEVLTRISCVLNQKEPSTC